MKPQQPRSTLFPYTTLFRSTAAREVSRKPKCMETTSHPEAHQSLCVETIKLCGKQDQPKRDWRSEEHTSELQSRPHLVCRLLLEKKKNITERREYNINLR